MNCPYEPMQSSIIERNKTGCVTASTYLTDLTGYATLPDNFEIGKQSRQGARISLPEGWRVSRHGEMKQAQFPG
jgi:hypothetical protein